MGRRLDYTVRFDASSEEIYRSFTSRQYWESLLEEYRDLTTRSQVTDFSSDHTGTRIVFTHIVRSTQLHPVVRAVVPADVIITREQHYEPYDHAAKRVKGRYRASVQSVRAHVQGSSLVTETSDGCQLQLSTACKVRIPLIGGKLEDLVICHVTELFDAEEAFTAEWINQYC
ncbi:MAG TPA: DUF2505 domain-containing protein [Mycobacterium sp.]|nr:DUF2505 domain-containing protein [Mycobacterium sp.]